MIVIRSVKDAFYSAIPGSQQGESSIPYCTVFSWLVRFLRGSEEKDKRSERIGWKNEGAVGLGLNDQAIHHSTCRIHYLYLHQVHYTSTRRTNFSRLFTYVV